MRTVVAMTGASGAMYGIRLLQNIPGEKVLVMSEMAKKIIRHETSVGIQEIEALADTVYEDDDLFAAISSGSHGFDQMVIIPCTASTLGKISSGIADTLITRAAAVALKERRKLVLVVRETPKSAILLENELRLARCGACILDANPGFYSRPKTVDDVIDFVVGRCLDQLGIEHRLYAKWERLAGTSSCRWGGHDILSSVSRMTSSSLLRHDAISGDIHSPSYPTRNGRSSSRI